MPGKPPATADAGAPTARREQLPARVRAAIQRHQDASEILIGWIQLGVLCTFAGLYLISPKPYSGELRLSPEPWFLATYLVFTLVRLWLAHRRLLPDAVLVISVVLDMVLLLGLIWSIHIKYDQPASFYLKAPTLLYVFIFIALRALRFEARYVVFAGSAAAFGWLLMVLYVVTVVPEDPMITRDYVSYLTSNSVLIGAEFDKIISIAMVTGIIALAITRARRLLVSSVVEQSMAAELSRFLPGGVAERLAIAEERPEAGQTEEVEATILFADMEGFTAVSDALSPAGLIRTLNEYFTTIGDPITRRGGVITQFQGDAILATFNLPDRVPDHAAQAIAAARDIQAALAARRFSDGRQLACRIGLNTGRVVGGLVGAGDRLGYTVHGDEVNLAARLEQLNKTYGTRVIASERTVRLAGATDFEPLGEVLVRGLRDPVKVLALGPVERALTAPDARGNGAVGEAARGHTPGAELAVAQSPGKDSSSSR